MSADWTELRGFNSHSGVSEEKTGTLQLHAVSIDSFEKQT